MAKFVKMGEVAAKELEGRGTLRLLVERATGAARLQVQLLDLTPNSEGAYHYHTEAEQVVLVLNGDGRLIVEGREHRVEPGTVVLLQPGEKHAVCAGEGGMKIIEIYSPPAPDFVIVSR